MNLTQIAKQKGVEIPTATDVEAFLRKGHGDVWDSYSPDLQREYMAKGYDKLLEERIKAKEVPVFYSAVEHAVKGAKQNTASPDQWIGYIRNQPGVKQEELSWMGLEDWLKEQKGPVSKKQIDDYVASHKVELKEIDKREGVGPDQERLEGMRREYEEAYGERLTDEELIGEYEALYNDKPAATKYSEYQLPGGENYRELLLTLPQKERKQGLSPDDFENGLFGGRKDAPYVSSHWGEPNVLAHVRVNDRLMGPTHKTETYYRAKSPDGDNSPYFTDRADVQDWVQRNAKPAGFRPEDYVIGSETSSQPLKGAGAKKTMFLEEVQSDWHQAGRKGGYKGEAGSVTKEDVIAAERAANIIHQKLHAKLVEAQPDLPKEMHRRLAADLIDAIEEGRHDPLFSPEETQLAKDYHEAWDKYKRTNRQFEETQGRVPDAPFKTTWPDLVLKRMIREAAEKGYDQIAWTPGEVQAARYDLSKHVKEIRAYRNKNGTFELVLEPENQASFSIKDVPAEKLSDHVGKELAEKIADQVVDEKAYTGLDLKVGGEGMKSFYDKMLVDKANALAKKHGGKVEKQNMGQAVEYVQAPNGRVWYPAENGTRVEGELFTTRERPVAGGPPEVDLFKSGEDGTTGSFIKRFGSKEDAHKYIQEQGKPQQVWVLPITPKMRDAAVGKGFPLFSSGVPFVPVDHDPFRKEPKLEPVDHDPFAVLPYDPNRT